MDPIDRHPWRRPRWAHSIERWLKRVAPVQRCLWLRDGLGPQLQRYACQVKREHGLGFQVRLGIQSGEVVVGKIGSLQRLIEE